MLAFGFVVANAIPFFEDFQNLLGSLTGAPILFGWHAFFYLTLTLYLTLTYIPTPTQA